MRRSRVCWVKLQMHVPRTWGYVSPLAPLEAKGDRDSEQRGGTSKKLKQDASPLGRSCACAYSRQLTVGPASRIHSRAGWSIATKRTNHLHMITTEDITIAKDVILAIAGVTTACVAVRGLNTWSRQLEGTANYEVARKLARAVYRLRNEIQACRANRIRAAEFPDGYKNMFKNSASDNGQAYAYVFSNRWGPVQEALIELDAQTLEGEALWGGSVRDKTDQIRTVARRLNVAMEAFVDNEFSGGDVFNRDQGFGVRVRSEVFASSGDEGNDLTKDLFSAVASIEAELRPHLRRKADVSGFSWLRRAIEAASTFPRSWKRSSRR